jgi:hypothetical protein
LAARGKPNTQPPEATPSPAETISQILPENRSNKVE